MKENLTSKTGHFHFAKSGHYHVAGTMPQGSVGWGFHCFYWGQALPMIMPDARLLSSRGSDIIIRDRPCIREDKLFYNATVIGIPVVI